MIKKGHTIKGSKALLLGITFKENCPDIRNSKVIDIYRELQQFGVETDVYDPLVNKDEVKKELGIDVITGKGLDKNYAAIIIAVAHTVFQEMDFMQYKRNNAVIFDIKGCIGKELADARL